MEPGGQGRCPGSPAASPVSRCWVSHRTDAAIAALAQCKRRCVTRLPSPGPPPLPKEPPRPQPPPHRMDARGRGTNPRGMRCGHPGATRVSPFHPLACTPQQAEPSSPAHARSLTWSCRRHSPACGLSLHCLAQKSAVGKPGLAGSVCLWPCPHAEEATEQMGSPEVGG